MRWNELFDRQVVLVSGKGGTGKSTVAAALATLAARRGLATLLVEMEGRGEIARTLGVPNPGFEERPTRHGFRVLSITAQPVLLEYLEYSAGLERVGRSLLRAGALDQVITTTPGLRDLLLAGKLYEIAEQRVTDRRRSSRPRYDVLVVDAPPTGQIVSLMKAPGTIGELARVGRIERQARQVDHMLRSRSGVVLVSLLEEMSVAETAEAAAALRAAGIAVEGIVANRVLEPVVRPDGGRMPGKDALVAAAARAGLSLSPDVARTVLADASATAARSRLQQRALGELARIGPVLELPETPREGPGLISALASVMQGVPPATPGGPRPGGPRPAGRAPAPLVSGGLGDRLAGTRIVVVCGSGGVGKTTLSAAVALRLARERDSVALLTVDPARRLATALGLPELPGGWTPVDLGEGRTLEAMQLDAKHTFDNLVERYAGSQASRDRILQNRFYRRIADTLAGTHEYMAMEKLYELATEERHDAIVIDTPPTRSAMSFLDAPARLTDFLSSRFLRILLWPSVRASRLTLGLARMGASAFARTVGRVVGADVLAEVTEFLMAFEGMYGGFRDRAERVMELLRAADCGFLIVAAPSSPSLAEAGSFLERLGRAGMDARAIVVNRTHQQAWELPPGTEQAADRLLAGAEAADRTAGAVLRSALRRQPQLELETRILAGFEAIHPRVPIVAVPELAQDVHDVAGLWAVAAQLFRRRSGGAGARAASRRR